MKKIELSEVKAMLREILAAKSASRESLSAVLWLGECRMEGKELHDLDELTKPFWAVVRASQNIMEDGIISIDESAWRELEGAYYNRVAKPLFF